VKLLMGDAYGTVSEYVIDNYILPELKNPDGTPAILMESNPFYPQRNGTPYSVSSPVKRVLDSFFVRPNPPYLQVDWIGLDPTSEDYLEAFGALRDALFAFTGKALLGVAPLKGAQKPWPSFSDTTR
jgi:hypothetical protein